MKLIFLDIDGVMNNLTDWINKVETKTEKFQGHKMFCDRSWELLSRLCAITGAKVVLSSSWRHMFDYDGEDLILLNADNHIGKMFINYVEKYGIPITGLTTFKFAHRGKQILDYLGSECLEAAEFVILDDEVSCILECFDEECVVKTDTDFGFCEEHYERALNILLNEGE